MIPDIPAPKSVVAVAVGGLLVATSGFVVRRVINSVEDRAEPSQREIDIGAIVGKTENVLVYSLVLVDAFTALAVILPPKVSSVVKT